MPDVTKHVPIVGTSSESDGLGEEEIPKKRRKPLPRYFGDCWSDDMNSPRRAKRSWAIATKTISLESKRPSRQKCPPELRAFALTLSFYSLKAYSYASEKFNNSLPHPDTISKWYRSIDGSPGFTEEAQTLLKAKVSEYESLSQKVEWTGQKFSGFVDIGTTIEGDTLLEARVALVFMLVGVNGHWMVSVGYFLIDGLKVIKRSALVFYDSAYVLLLSSSLDYHGFPEKEHLCNLSHCGHWGKLADGRLSKLSPAMEALSFNIPSALEQQPSGMNKDSLPPPKHKSPSRLARNARRLKLHITKQTASQSSDFPSWSQATHGPRNLPGVPRRPHVETPLLPLPLQESYMDPNPASLYTDMEDAMQLARLEATATLTAAIIFGPAIQMGAVYVFHNQKPMIG
ncbi:hypothetical protein NQ314_021382 [Rhamnusium bicolor]|uniref:Uncharacterized protein n=1 Tax=Rhamnusium bicolor TaxID=1586634 RepID=A0AAV8WKD5_9CUCU|nr:hypothetical protein NQ314_021382 [Rhamnusium bicolor]